MEFEYKAELQEISETVGQCPPEGTEERQRLGYRFVFDPIQNALNFLPNTIFDQKQRLLPRKLNKNHINNNLCIRMGQSFFDTSEAALEKWNNFSRQIQMNLGYTHLAEGIIEKNDGRTTQSLNHHFTLFVYKENSIRNNFQITQAL